MLFPFFSPVTLNKTVLNGINPTYLWHGNMNFCVMLILFINCSQIAAMKSVKDKQFYNTTCHSNHYWSFKLIFVVFEDVPCCLIFGKVFINILNRAEFYHS